MRGRVLSGAALNVLGGLTDGDLRPDGVIYPGAFQGGVRTGVISWQDFPFGPAVVLTQAALRDARGSAVPMHTEPASGYFNLVAIKPDQPLAPGTTYTVEMHVALGGRQLARAWTFSTRS